MPARLATGVNAHERQSLLDRVDREGATVGTQIPETLELEDGRVALRERILSLQRAGSLDPDQEADRHELVVALRRGRSERYSRLESDPDLDRETGETLVAEIIGIDRALAALRDLEESDNIEALIQRKQVENTQRWRHFIDQASLSDLSEQYSK